MDGAEPSVTLDLERLDRIRKLLGRRPRSFDELLTLFISEAYERVRQVGEALAPLGIRLDAEAQAGLQVGAGAEAEFGLGAGGVGQVAELAARARRAVDRLRCGGCRG